MNAPCPRCRQDAPLIYRGVEAVCSACGAPRMPLSAQSLEHSGRASRVGGTVARAVGFSILFGGLFLSLMAAIALQLMWPAGVAGYLLGLPLAVISVVVGIALLRGGSSLSTAGREARRIARERAIVALAANQGGLLTARDVARAHGLSEADADGTLTEMAQRSGDVTVDVDDDRGVVYRFRGSELAAAGPRARVATADDARWDRLEENEAAATRAHVR